jgi:predicted DNA-binding protein with PD1-like motif
MLTQLISEAPQTAGDTTQRSYSVVFEPGEEVMERLAVFAREQGITQASFEAIGGFQQITLAFFNTDTKAFDEIPAHEDQVEVLSLTGDITPNGEDLEVHVHTVLGRPDGSTLGGHLVRGVARPALIVTLTESAHRPAPHHG